MANDHTQLLTEAREELQAAREARGSTTADGRAIAAGLASIAASLLVLAEEEASREEKKQHRVPLTKRFRA